MPEIVASKYNQVANTFIAKDQSFAETEVGDALQPDFHPQVKIKRWDNEANFSARLVHEEETPQVITEAGKIKWLGAKVEAHFYDTGSLKEDEGGYEFEIVLKEPPKSNRISFTIQSRGLDFFYQYPLKNLNPDGSCWEDNGRGGIRSRPAKATGSYAVYHRTRAGDYTALGGKNYKAGKAFHLYRPRIEDAAGAWCWGELNIEVKAGLLTVTIPQDWLDKAVYPVRHAAGLEFGYHTVPTGGDDWNNADAPSWAKAASTPASDGSLTSITIYGKSRTGSPTFCPALYSDSFGPNSRLAYVNSGGTAFGASFGWVTTDISYASIASGVQYWLGFKTALGSGADFDYKFDSGSGELPWTVTGANWPATASPQGTADERLGIYATYSAGGGVTGTLAGTLAAVTGSIAGAHGVAGATAGTLGSVTGSATGVVRVEGALAGSLAPVTGSAAAVHGVSGSMAGTLAAVTVSISGAHGVAGIVAGTLAAVTGAFSGTAMETGEVTGTLAGMLANVTGSNSGAHGVAGTVAGTVASVSGSASGTVRAEGSLTGNLTPVIGSISGTHGVAGSVAGTLANVAAAGSGTHGVAGALAGQLSPVTASIIGATIVSGILSGTLPPITASITGQVGPDTADSWKFPALFSDSGFQYGDYDPGQAAAIAIGCLHIYMKTGDERAGTWARRILDDLRVNRQDQDYGGYRSDRRYGWLNALVLQTFGLGVNGVPGQSYRFPGITKDKAHFDALISWIMARAGDAKPNVLNSDLIPFTFSEAGDMWSYAPNYLAMGQMGSLEAVVLMLGGALEHGKILGDWEWFKRLLAFMVRDNLVVLSPAQIRAVTAACDQAGAANLVRLRYADYDRDGSKYFEARDQAAIDNWGEQALDLDFRYGSPVILEDPGMARLLAERLLQRLAPPLEAAEVETWLEGARIELGDTVAVSSDFHGWDREEFTVLGKNLDLGRRRVHLKLSRTMDYADSWAMDAAGSAFDAWAIDLDSSWDDHWDSRAYVY